uniref:Cytochrome b6f complex subunit n=1 Tax=Paulinella micropora TaxID=1928728 RepID=A0A385HZZ6_9EUKA|nr:cytochrome b6f complex subunit [Paulinella micropora]AXY63226.1 cytochrome b6f complex subunit [Paulinella micropora]
MQSYVLLVMSAAIYLGIVFSGLITAFLLTTILKGVKLI